jgi:hypothetical protein
MKRAPRVGQLSRSTSQPGAESKQCLLKLGNYTIANRGWLRREMGAKQGDGRLRREMGGKVGRWVAKQEDGVAKQGDGWLRREMGG